MIFLLLFVPYHRELNNSASGTVFIHSHISRRKLVKNQVYTMITGVKVISVFSTGGTIKLIYSDEIDFNFPEFCIGSRRRLNFLYSIRIYLKEVHDLAQMTLGYMD